MKRMCDLILCGTVMATVSLGQVGNSLESVEQEIVSLHERIMDAGYDVREDLNRNLRKTLVRILQDKRAADYRFDRLRKHMRVAESDDGRLRIFSWDEGTGGTARVMSAIAQARDSSGSVFVHAIDTTYGGLTGESEALYDSVVMLVLNSRVHYLAFGRGTPGSGHHYRTIRSFRIGNDHLIADSLFASDKRSDEFIVIAARRYAIGLEFNPGAQEIIYDEFLEDEESGFFMPTGRKRKLVIRNGTFIRAD